MIFDTGINERVNPEGGPTCYDGGEGGRSCI
uniref:Uncharacterized protein n=1 Tax=Caudovirales sp. ct7964 TaxID=2825758 RepID=A0A8S5PEP6_9CAUD|nr:MAG TPA: hypothetical protein [Caudovirales sp. ct7964]